MQLDGALAELAKERAKELAEVANEQSDLHREIRGHAHAQRGT
jgi:hypothetical protein